MRGGVEDVRPAPGLRSCGSCSGKGRGRAGGGSLGGSEDPLGSQGMVTREEVAIRIISIAEVTEKGGLERR